MIYIQRFFESFQQHQIVLKKIISKHQSFLRLEYFPLLHEFFGIIPQEINLILLPFKDLIFNRVLLILLSDDAHCPSNIILFFYLLVRDFVDHRFLDDHAGLELLAVEDFGCFGDHWEVLGEYGVTSYVRKGDSFVCVQLEYL